MNLNQQNKSQQGFVLILVLVMLAVLTLIGVSSMNSSSMELKSAANAKQHSIAFNVVQSVIEFAVSIDGAADINYQTNDPTETQIINTADFVLVDTDGNSSDVVVGGSDYSASVKFSGCGIAPGSSMQKGKSFSYNFFDITASGKNAVGTASSVQTQGIRFPAASC